MRPFRLAAIALLAMGGIASAQTGAQPAQPPGEAQIMHAYATQLLDAQLEARGPAPPTRRSRGRTRGGRPALAAILAALVRRLARLRNAGKAMSDDATIARLVGEIELLREDLATSKAAVAAVGQLRDEALARAAAAEAAAAPVPHLQARVAELEAYFADPVDTHLSWVRMVRHDADGSLHSSVEDARRHGLAMRVVAAGGVSAAAAANLIARGLIHE